MDKLILFDWGNILLNSSATSYSIDDAQKDILKDINPKHNEKLEKLFYSEKFWTLSERMLEKHIEKYLIYSGCNCSVVDFKKIYLEHYSKVPWFNDIVNLFRNITMTSGFYTGILSTLCEMDATLLEKYLPLQKCAYRFFSFNLGVQKPDKRIYDIVETVTGFLPENILFIDDRKENILAAELRGWNTVWASGSESQKISEACYSFMGKDYAAEKFSKTLFDAARMRDY